MADINRYISCVFDEIRGELEEYYIFKEKIKINDYLLKIFYEMWGKYAKASKLDYNPIASSFNKVYFWKNLLKSLIFFDKFYDLIGNSILDVGCGAAPVSIAITKLIKKRKEENLSVSLIDKSKNQLRIAKDITQIMSINVKSYTEDFFEMPYENYSELVIFSYFFCEQRSDFLKILFNNRKKFSGGFAIIDYRDNIVKIEKYFRENGDNGIESVFLNYSVPKIISELIHDSEVNIYGCLYRP